MWIFKVTNKIWKCSAYQNGFMFLCFMSKGRYAQTQCSSNMQKIKATLRNQSWNQALRCRPRQKNLVSKSDRTIDLI